MIYTYLLIVITLPSTVILQSNIFDAISFFQIIHMVLRNTQRENIFQQQHFIILQLILDFLALQAAVLIKVGQDNQ